MDPTYIPPAPTDNGNAPQSGAEDYYGGFVAPPTYIPPTGQREYTFEEKFIVNKPKYNDVWAGILVISSLSSLFMKMLIVNIPKVRTGHPGLCSS